MYIKITRMGDLFSAKRMVAIRGSVAGQPKFGSLGDSGKG